MSFPIGFRDRFGSGLDRTTSCPSSKAVGCGQTTGRSPRKLAAETTFYHENSYSIYVKTSG